MLAFWVNGTEPFKTKAQFSANKHKTGIVTNIVIHGQKSDFSQMF